MRSKLTTSLFGFAVLATAAVSFAQSNPAADAVREASDTAERAAGVESALRSLEADGESDQAGEAARSSADAVLHAARAFRPITIPTGAAAWKAAGLDLNKATEENGRLVQVLDNGTKVTFTVDPDVQRNLTEMLDARNVAHGSVVLIDPPTGRVLAMSSHTEHETAPVEDLAQKSLAPSASVFKVVTAAALIDAGIDPNKPTCYHGGRSSLTKGNIVGNKKLDTRCAKLDAALAWSINSVMAKLAYNHLKPEDLRRWAENFGYNTEIPFEFEVEVSKAEFVEDPYERARSAAGFWHTYLSPLHGAMIGAGLANEGVMMQPSIIERVETADGRIVREFEPKVFRTMMTPEQANLLGDFMVMTTTQGTARKYFQRSGFPSDITVSGKTGTLSNKDPYLGFTWFVGFAERDGERVGVSGLACNTPLWQIKGSFAASEGVRRIFEAKKRAGQVASN